MLALLLTAQASDAQPILETLQSRAEAVLSEHYPALVDIRHHIHRNPELSGQEVETSRLVADHLESLGFEVRRGVGGYGVIGLLRGSSSGPTVAFRADMDAVRSTAPDPAPYASKTPGIRHICGHDIHTTVGLAVAEAFAAIRSEIAGSILLIFQPAEETASGAEAMLQDDVFSDGPPDALFALHTAPYPVGTVATTAGGMMASRSNLTVRLSGSGDLRDAAQKAREVISGLGTVHQPLASAAREDILVQVRGSGPTITAQIMTADQHVQDELGPRIASGLKQIDVEGVAIQHDFQPGSVAGVTNDPALVDRSLAALRSLASDVTVSTVGSVIPAFSEDFGSFQRRGPGMMYFLGVSNPATGTTGMPHSPDYVADDRSISVGARVIVASMLASLSPSEESPR